MGMSAPTGNAGQPQHSLPVPIRGGPGLTHGGSTGDVSSIGRADSKRTSTKTSFNRFSTFVKSGGESFVLGKLNAKVQETDVIQVVVSFILILSYPLYHTLHRVAKWLIFVRWGHTKSITAVAQ